jgi:hypothetical protein
MALSSSHCLFFSSSLQECRPSSSLTNYTDDVLALRIDVVACAEQWTDQLRSPHKDDFEWADKLDELEEKLYRAVCRYQAAVAKRRHT